MALYAERENKKGRVSSSSTMRVLFTVITKTVTGDQYQSLYNSKQSTKFCTASPQVRCSISSSNYCVVVKVAYIYMYTHTHTHIYYIYIYTCVCVRTARPMIKIFKLLCSCQDSMHLYIYTHIHIYSIYMWLYICVCVCVVLTKCYQ